MRLALLNPIKNTFELYRYYYSLSSQFTILEILHFTIRWTITVGGLKSIMPIAFFAAIAKFCFNEFKQIKTNRALYSSKSFVNIVILGAIYTSAMSYRFQPDSVLLIIFALVRLFKQETRETEKKINSFLKIALTISILSICFYSKLYRTTYAWWESNIQRSSLVSLSKEGLLVTPFYAKISKSLNDLKEFSESNSIPISIYSFPTSTIRYQILNYLPKWEFAVHHSDVFPNRYVESEYAKILQVSPRYNVISKWTQEMISELDGDFSVDRLTLTT